MPESLSHTGSSFKLWKGKDFPKRILAIRLQALGDTFIAVSYLQNLRNQLPKETRIDVLVRDEFKEIPLALELFDKVHVLKGGNRTRHQLLNLIPVMIGLKFNRYDVVLDLQNNFISNLTRKFLNPACFSEFDRFSAKHAGTRTKETINKAAIIELSENYQYTFKNKFSGKTVLENAGWKGEKLVVLNPGGVHENRNWPVHRYIEVAQQLLDDYDKNLKFVVIGTDRIAEKASLIENSLQDKVLNLAGKTSQVEALAMLQLTELIISEDSGLLHMAYLSGKKTIGILGATRSDWVDPKLPHTFFFTSDDLECGNCMLDRCKFNELICLNRISSQMVFDSAVNFLNGDAHA